MPLEQIDPYPWFLNKRVELTVSEQTITTKFTSSQWADHWRPLMARLLDLWLATRPKRIIIALAGPPGSGKSTLAHQIHWLVDKGVLHRDAHSMALPMEGFLYPPDYLATHHRILPDGTKIPLSEVKGSADTIDAVLLRRHLQALIARPEYVSWPGYSRYTRDIIPFKFRVHQTVNFVVMEGNFLLLNRGPFAPIPPLFDLRIYVDAPVPMIISNLVDHHLQMGREMDYAKDLTKRIDLPNARVAESTKGNADVIIERESNDEISSIVWRGEEMTSSSTGAAGGDAGVAAGTLTMPPANAAAPLAPGSAQAPPTIPPPAPPEPLSA